MGRYRKTNFFNYSRKCLIGRKGKEDIMADSNKYELTEKEETQDEEVRIEKMLREIDGMGQNDIYKELLVDGAVFGCQYGNQYSQIEKSSLEYAYVGFDEVLLDKDRPNKTFGVCHSPYLSESDRKNQITVTITASENKKVGKRITETGPACVMKLSQEWNLLGRGTLIFDWNDEEYHSLPTTQSYLVCYHGNGCVFPVDSGQKITLPKPGEVGERIIIDGTNNLDEKWIYTPTDNREVAFGIAHPIATTAIGKVKPGEGVTNISTNSTRFASGLELGENENKEGSEVNAFRHTLWEATITNKFDFDIAKEIADSHEENPNSVDVINEKYGGIHNVVFKTLLLADEAADLLNNIEGRKIGGSMKEVPMKEIAGIVLTYFHENGLWQAVDMNNGYFEVQKIKLSDMRYNNAVLLFSEMDDNGFPPHNPYYKKSEATEQE